MQKISGYKEIYRAFNKLMELMEAIRLPEAVELSDALRASGTRDKNIWWAMLATYIDGGEAEKALEAARNYGQLFGRDGVGLFLLGRAEMMNDDWGGAEQCFLEALQMDMPDWYRGATHSIYATLCRKLGRAEQAAEHYRESCRYKDLSTGALAEYSNYLFNLHYQAKPQDFMLAAAQGYGRLLAGVKPYQHQKPYGHKKLRLGYISPDLRFHVVAFFCYAMLKDYDRQAFEVYCYTNCEEDAASAEFQASATVWHNVRGWPDEKVAALIRDEEIDILVELAGHTANNFLPVLAYKPAPVQVSGIGYFDTTGLEAVDYFLADPYIDPVVAEGGNDRYFTERLLRLPHSHFCYMWHDRPGPVSRAPCLRKGYVTFGSLNTAAKLSDRILELWAEILRRVPGSRLRLRAEVFGNAYGRQEMEKRLQTAGIELARVKAYPLSPHYLEDYREIDIALDTWPYPGGGTTCDALYMGVPVVTLVGERHNARFGYSLLMNVGFAEGCAATAEEYVEKAVALAGDAEKLDLLHLTLRRRMRVSPLMDSVAYLGELELLWQKIYLDYERELLPEQELAARRRGWLQELDEAYQKEDWAETARLAARLKADKAAANHAWRLAGIAYYKLGDWGRAAWHLRQAVRYDAEHDAECWRLCALAETERSHYLSAYKAMSQARACLDREGRAATEADAFRADVLAKGSQLAVGLGLTEEAVAGYRAAAACAATTLDRLGLYSSSLLARHALSWERESLLAAHKSYAAWVDELGIKQYKEWPESRLAQGQTGPLRVGVISPDFRQHVMFYFYYQLLAGHDRKKWEVYAYSLGEMHDWYTEQVEHFAAVFRDMHGQDMQDIAAQIRADGIDVLVDLAGHSAGSGLPVLAFRPAPVQVSGLGYMATTGLKQVDAFLTDRWADPPEREPELVEQPLYLTSQFCYTGRSDVPEPGGAPCLAKGYITFGCFNQYCKITDEMLQLWRELLLKVPRSRLLLKNRSFRDDETVLLVQERLCRLGLPLGRVELEADSSDYMTRYLEVDIALDTYPYTGGGTTCDALYMGVPVISLYGERRGSRFGLSILQNAGLGELACADAEVYAAKALALARDTDLLDALHKNLRPMLLSSSLMDTQNYIRELEAGFRKLAGELAVRR
ncbi:MAG: hypothetical protein IJU00_12780 [Selenomonas sp.]|nr:hypothetical protein [Selenomonas sp.]